MKSTVINVKGVKYTFTSLDARAVQEYLDWAKVNMPDPIDEVMQVAQKLPEDVRKDFIDKNLQPAFEKLKLRGTLSDPDLGAFELSPKGLGKILSLMLTKNHPGLTDHEALRVVEDATDEHGEDKFIEMFRSCMRVSMTEGEAEARYFSDKGKRTSRRTRTAKSA